MKKNKKLIFLKYEYIFAPILLGIVALILLYRNLYTFCWTDESLYVATVHRIFNGERMFADEWYTSQLTVPFMLPFYALYRLIVGSTEGIYLYFRFVYWLISVVISFCGYSIFRKQYSGYTSAVSMLIYLLYSRANIGGMSYYNMTLSIVILSCFFIYYLSANNTAFSQAKRVAISLCIGILIAIAIVYNPYLIFACIISIIYFFFSKRLNMYRGEVIWMILGSVITGIAYMTYILSMCSIQDILFNIPYILGEPELQETNPILSIPLMFVRIAWAYKNTIVLWLASIAYHIFLKNKKKDLTNKKWINVVILLNFAIFIINCFCVRTPLGCINFAIVMLMIPILMLNDDALLLVCNSGLIIFIVAGIGLSFAFTFSSDTGLDAMGIGFVPLAMASIFLLSKTNYYTIQEHMIKRINIEPFVRISICLAILLSLILRVFSVYRDAPIMECKVRIKNGPAAGLYTTQNHKDEYEKIIADIEKYQRGDDIVLFSREGQWCYTCTDNEIGSYSTWRVWIVSDRFKDYYEINPNKIPTFVYIFDEYIGSYESDIIQNNEIVNNPNANTLDGYLYNYLCSNSYEVIKTECGTIFRKMDM